MLYQANFLDQCSSQVLPMLADNTTHPLNEYALVAVNFGLAGIAVLLSGIAITIIHYFRNRGDESFVGMMVLAGISVLSLFSYPFRYPLTVLGLLCALVLVYKDVLLRRSLLHIGDCHKTTRKQACRQVQALDTRYLYK
jgi:hypothetical protein